MIASVTLLAAAESPVIPGEKPVRYRGVGAGEGPAWDRRGNLYFTGSNRITIRDSSGTIRIFRDNTGGANGLLFDHDGRLVICEGGNRRVVRIEADGTTTVLADSYESKRFNSPNDLTIDTKGRIYFSDPRYGNRDGMEMSVEAVYRIDAPGKVTRILADEVDRPNGLLVSARDEYLYVADNNNSEGGARKLWRFRLSTDGSADPRSRTLIFDWGTGRGPDGIDMDESGLLYVAAGRTSPRPPHETADRFKGGIYILSPGGGLVEFIHITDDEVTNCAFGGVDGKTLFITAGGNLWSLRLKIPGYAPSKN